MSSRFVQLLLLPLEQQPQPTHTLKKGVYVPMDKQSSHVGMRGQVPGALYMPSEDGGPPAGFKHVWYAPASLVSIPRSLERITTGPGKNGNGVDQ